MLDRYLDGLVDEDKKKEASQAAFGAVSMNELAKLAGISLREDICTSCGDTMEKRAHTYRCSCGMVKAAMSKCGKCGNSMEKTSMGSKCASCGGCEKTAAVDPGEMLGGDEAEEARQQALIDEQSRLRQQYSVPEQLGLMGRVLGPAALGALAGGAVGRRLRPGVGSDLGTIAGGLSGLIGGGQWATGRDEELQEKYRGAEKQASSTDEDIVRVGDAAGRLLAKTAMAPDMSAPIPLEEIRESIQEAQAREDVPGRARRWQIGGAGAGALGAGAAGYGAGRLIGPKAGLLGAGLGAVGGALGGQALGKEYGAEEARADKAVAMLRALRAHQQGAMSGYGAGMQRGYQMGQAPAYDDVPGAPDEPSKMASLDPTRVRGMGKSAGVEKILKKIGG
jgi:hypothetical protein